MTKKQILFLAIFSLVPSIFNISLLMYGIVFFTGGPPILDQILGKIFDVLNFLPQAMGVYPSHEGMDGEPVYTIFAGVTSGMVHLTNITCWFILGLALMKFATGKEG